MKTVIITNARGEIIMRFETIVEAAKFYGINKSAMAYRAKTRFTINGETTSFEDVDVYDKLMDKEMRRNEKIYEDGFPFDERKHIKIKYEVNRSMMCITPCPYLEAPKPFVGSGRCQSCQHFKYKDKGNRIVICSGHKF